MHPKSKIQCQDELNRTLAQQKKQEGSRMEEIGNNSWAGSKLSFEPFQKGTLQEIHKYFLWRISSPPNQKSEFITCIDP
jgi:hypothetical protein